ncbi:MAG: hypothetical protein B6D63_05400 [Candidatus Latescibacteria bacterium 4484_7]|nr:MAG: hypothetical protein B6D63_05400 [Candidatus Latescibacteria bacterium 4484_7]
MRPIKVVAISLILLSSLRAEVRSMDWSTVGGRLVSPTPDTDSALVEYKNFEDRRTSFLLEEGQKKISTGITFIIPQSDSLYLNFHLLSRERDYRINYLKGTIILVKAASPGDKIILEYRRYPFSFPPVFVSHSPTMANSPIYRRRIISRVESKERTAPRYRLRVSGSKSIGINIGTGRGLGLDQSLHVSMSGKVTKGMEVSAYLTDDNLPVQPEGNTAEIKQLDRVFVKLKTARSEIVFGDHDTGLDWSRFSAFKRELRGISVSYGESKQRFFGGAGIAKGRFRTVSFMGKDGIQGPYELIPSRTFNGVIILPGTEKVYLNGRVLKRGSNNDYTIDYVLGTVQFTENVTITRDSEITVDFEISEDYFRRSTVYAGWESPNYRGLFKVKTFFLQEGDDASRPLNGTLTAEDRSILASAGDDERKALTSGIKKVDEGKGNYIFVKGDSLPDHFEFVESGGDYVLNFINVGTGKGDYTTDGFSIRGEVKYKYVGAGIGDYIIGKRLALPERNRLASVRATFEGAHLGFVSEGNFSWHDRNLLSGIDDSDNFGTAFRLEGKLRDLKLGAFKMSLSTDYSSLGDRFESPEKNRTSYFYRNWNLEGVPLVGTERIGSGKIDLQYGRLLRAGAGFSYLSRTSGISSRKNDYSLSIADELERGLKLVSFRSETNENRERIFFRGQASYALWHILPRYYYETERYSSFQTSAPDTGRYYIEQAMSVSSFRTRSFSAAIEAKRRNTDNMVDSLRNWIDSYRSDELNLKGSFTHRRRMLDILVTHRRNDDLRAHTTNWYELARLRYKDALDRFAMTTDIDYRITSGEERTRERSVIYVGKNQGDYDSEGKEVGQKRGDYMLVYLPGASLQKAHTVKLDFRLGFGGGIRGIGARSKGGGLISRLSRFVSLDNFVSVEEDSKTDDLLGLYTLRPSLLQRNDLTIYGITRVMQEWHFFNSVKMLDIAFTFNREDEKDNRSVGDPVDRFTREMKLRANVSMTKRLSILWEIGEGKRERFAISSGEQNYDVRDLSASQRIDYRYSPAVKFSMEAGAEKRLDRLSTAGQVSYFLAPHINSSMSKRLNVNSTMKITYTSTNGISAKPLFFLEEGLREDWSVMAHYRLTTNLSFGINYFGRREKDYTGEVKTVHDFKMESRAYF